MQEITRMTAAALAAALQRKELSSREAAEAYLSEIDARDGEIGAYLTVTAERAIAQAEAVDARRAAGSALPPLAGVPAGLKDNLCTKGVRTACASRMLEQFVPPYDAGAVERLEKSGVVTLGKLNMDEFAMGSTTEHSALRQTRNPRAPGCVPGGSSGG